MKGIAFLAFVLFFLLPLAMISGRIDGPQALSIAVPSLLGILVFTALALAADRLVTWLAAHPPDEAMEEHITPPNPAALGLYFASGLIGVYLLIWYFREEQVVSDFIANDFSGRRPGFLLMGLPVMLILAYAKWLDDRS